MFLWLAEHALAIGGTLAILIAFALGAAVFSGLLTVGKIIKALLDIVAAFVEFFAKPKEQIAGKVLFALAVFALGASLAHIHTTYQVNKQWKVREAEAARKLEEAEKQRDARITTDLHAQVTDQLAALQSKSDELQSQVDAYEAERRKAPADAVCRLSDDDIARMRLDEKRRPLPGVNQPRVNSRKRLP